MYELYNEEQIIDLYNMLYEDSIKLLKESGLISNYIVNKNNIAKEIISVYKSDPDVFELAFEDLPLYVNDSYYHRQIVVNWRLKHGI
jgi:hypothetical protein